MRRLGDLRSVRADWRPRAVASGFLAAAAMLTAWLLAYALSLAAAAAALPEPLRGWFFGLTHNRLTDLAGDAVYAAAGVHLLVAIGLALLYARWVEPALGGPDWLRGATFSLVPWLLSVGVVLPLSGGGPFGAELGAGPLPAVGNLVLHLVYGATLGALYGEFGDLTADQGVGAGAADDPEAVRRQETLMARGAVIGLAVGLAVGAVTAALVPAARLGAPTGSLLFGWATIGGALGAFLCSFVALNQAGDDGPVPAAPVASAGTRRDAHGGAKVGAMLGAVALGPVGMPLGAAAGGVVDALRPPAGAVSGHTHNVDQSPCYDGCPSWHPSSE